MQAQAIRSVRRLGHQRSLDFEVGHSDHNFYAEGIVVSNCHSDAYAKITAFTLWFKAKYPLQFYWANLQMIRHESEKYEKLSIIEQEMNAMGFKLLPPHFNHSEVGFKIEGNNIRFALGMIRGVSDKNVQKLELFRAEAGLTANKFQLFQAIKNAGLNVGIGSALIQAGCMSGYDVYRDKEGKQFSSRSRLVLEFALWCRSDLLNDKERSACLAIGDRPEINWDVLLAVKHLSEALDEKAKPIIKPSRFETIKKKYTPYKEIYQLNSRNERLANFYYEKRTLGYSYSEQLRQIFAEYVDGLVTVAEAKKLPANTVCRLIGFVKEEPYTNRTKAGNKQLKLYVADETGDIAVKCFNERIDSVQEQNGRLPVQEDLVICNVKVMGPDMCFGQAGPDGTIIGIQSARIFMKLSELKDSKAEKEAAT